jgi:hypothetical protein
MIKITIWKWLLAIIVILAVFLYVPTFIAGPDGLEAVFETYGFTPPNPIWNGLLPDYTIPWIMDAWVTSLLSGILGTLIVFAIAYAFGKVIIAKTPHKK